jgi:hypothetical protein
LTLANSKGRKRIWLVTIVAAASATAVLVLLLAFTNLSFYFMNGKEIEVTGQFIGCAPTKMLAPCIRSGFKDTSGNYYLITNLQQAFEANPDLLPLIQAAKDAKSSNNNQFRITGVFSHGSPTNYEAADVIGVIEATSVTDLTTNGGAGKTFKVNDLLVPYVGIDNDNAIVTIRGKQYYMTTVKDVNNIWQIPRGYNIRFHNVTFSFPYGSLLSPGGALVVFEVRYPDGSTEKFGSASGGAAHAPLGISSIPGAAVPDTQTALGRHQNPNVGLTIHNKGEQIKLLVSKD